MRAILAAVLAVCLGLTARAGGQSYSFGTPWSDPSVNQVVGAGVGYLIDASDAEDVTVTPRTTTRTVTTPDGGVTPDYEETVTTYTTNRTDKTISGVCWYVYTSILKYNQSEIHTGLIGRVEDIGWIRPVASYAWHFPGATIGKNVGFSFVNTCIEVGVVMREEKQYFIGLSTMFP